MMSRTGNKDAFSLLEVLVASVLLTLGAVFLFPSFFMASDALGIAHDQLVVQPWADDKLWDDAQALAQAGVDVPVFDTGEVVLAGKTYTWERSLEQVDPGLFALALTVRWAVAGKERKAVYVTWVTTLS